MKIRFFNIISLSIFLIYACACKQTTNQTAVQKTIVDSIAAFTLKKGEVNKQISFPAELIPMEKAEIFPNLLK